MATSSKKKVNKVPVKKKSTEAVFSDKSVSAHQRKVHVDHVSKQVEDREKYITAGSSNNRIILCITFALLFILQIVSLFNTDGSVIRFMSDLFKGLISWGVWLLAPVFLYCSVMLAMNRDRPVAFRVLSALLLPVIFSAIISLAVCPVEQVRDVEDITYLYKLGKEFKAGGAISGFIACILKNAFSVYASYPILLILLLFFTIKCFNINLQTLVKTMKFDDEACENKNVPLSAALSTSDDISGTMRGERTLKNKNQAGIPKASKSHVKPAAVAYDIPLNNSDEISEPAYEIIENEPEKLKRKVSVTKKKTSKGQDSVTLPCDEEFTNFEENTEITHPDYDDDDIIPISAKPKTLFKDGDRESESAVKRIDRKEISAQADSIAREVMADYTDSRNYKFPPVDLLAPPSTAKSEARDELLTNRSRLEASLHSFGINANITGIIHGPTVTRYDIELDPGVKLARVTNLSGDIALSLGVSNVRIAPIPEKVSTVGIEVPNKITASVALREIIDSAAFSASKSKLSFALGKNISGDCVVGNISKLPHMLIAGTTGSGKSVCMNCLILSLLYKSSPDEVRMIMIDPKMVELGIYNSIPHLFVPVVTDPKKAAGALQWSVVEMLKRYRSFSEEGVRDLDSYNAVCTQKGIERLPRVVIVIDELADLMMVASKEVEESICRVAQMGRAAGMHLVIATQRPSADVITGLMKANIPSRIAFAVSSAMESRIILDQSGAEKLIGMGDMLYSPVGCGKPVRIQGAFVSDEEREKIVNFIKDNSGTVNDSDEIKAFMEKASEASSADKNAKEAPASSEYDEMLPKAVDVVLEMKSCSVSMLQRRIKLGYSRAARIVDQMEELGVVGPYEGSKPRSVTIDRNEWDEMKIRLGIADSSGITPDSSFYSEDSGE